MEEDNEVADYEVIKDDVVMEEAIDEVDTDLMEEQEKCLICKAQNKNKYLNISASFTSCTNELAANVLAKIFIKKPIDEVTFFNTSMCQRCFNLLDRADELQNSLLAIKNELDGIKEEFRTSLSIKIKSNEFGAIDNESFPKCRRSKRKKSKKIYEDYTSDDEIDTEVLMAHTSNEVSIECSFCGLLFLDQELFDEHVLSAHSSTNCSKCEINFNSREEMLEHYQQIHMKEEESSFVCRKCGEEFDDPDLYDQHVIASKHTNCGYYCDICFKKFATKEIFEEHNSVHHVKPEDLGTTIYTCKTCKETFDNKIVYKKHIKRGHRKLIQQCTDCEKTFMSKKTMQEHYKHAHFNQTNMEDVKEPRLEKCDAVEFFSRKDFSQCMFCSLVDFSSVDDYFEHYLAEHDQFSYIKCLLCNSSIMRGYNNFLCHFIYDHPTENVSHGIGELIVLLKETNMKIEENMYEKSSIENNNPYQCVVCFKRCVSHSSLLQHRKFHSSRNGDLKANKISNKYAKCCFCEESFQWTSSLLVHLGKEHTKFWYIKCKICGKFLYRGFIKSHMKHEHQQGERKKNYPCSLCEDRFETSTGRDRHIKIYHEGKKEYVCDYCGYEFTRVSAMRMHIRKRHVVQKNTHKCKICLKLFNSSSSIRCHVHKVHKLFNLPRINDPLKKHLLPYERIAEDVPL